GVPTEQREVVRPAASWRRQHRHGHDAQGDGECSEHGNLLSALLRGHAERRMARAARLAAERRDELLRGRLVPRLRRVTELLGLGLEILRRRLELRPLLPNFWLGRRLRRTE